MAHIRMWNMILLTGNTFRIMVLYLNSGIKCDRMMVYLGFPIIMAHQSTAKSVEQVEWKSNFVSGGMQCEQEPVLSVWCCLVPVSVPTDSWLLTRTMKEQIAPLSIISPSSARSLSISTHCASSFYLFLTPTCTHTHHMGGLESPCFTAALHCCSVCTLQCMVWPQAWQLLHSSVCVCCPSLRTVGQCKNISSDRCLSVCLSVCLFLTHTHTRIHTLESDQYGVLGAGADIDIREQENSNIRYIAQYQIYTVHECCICLSNTWDKDM